MTSKNGVVIWLEKASPANARLMHRVYLSGRPETVSLAGAPPSILDPRLSTALVGTNGWLNTIKATSRWRASATPRKDSR